MKLVNNVLDLVGETSMIRLSFPGAEADIFAKLEYLNPSGSIKDRIALFMIEQAERRGDLKPGYTIVEATSGNTGIALSLTAAAKGYKMVIVMPENTSLERRTIMKHYGANVVLTPAKDFVEGAIRRAKDLARQSSWWMPAQFENPDNVAAHIQTTGKEILRQVPKGWVDAFVAAIGTGGTLMGISQTLKEVNPNVEIIAVEPIGSRSKGVKRIKEHLSVTNHKIEGVGDGFVPPIVNIEMIDEWVQVCDEDAIETACRLAKEEGLFVGISSGANVYASLKTAKRLGKGKIIATVLPDSADRYYSTELCKK